MARDKSCKKCKYVGCANFGYPGVPPCEKYKEEAKLLKRNKCPKCRLPLIRGLKHCPHCMHIL